MKKIVCTDKAPGAIGPYSQGIQVGDLFFFSGQLPIDPKTGEMPEGIANQTIQSFENIKGLLESQGLTFNDVVKTTVFLNAIEDFAAMNEIYATYFTDTFPARSAFEVAALPKGALVEVEVIAGK